VARDQATCTETNRSGGIRYLIHHKIRNLTAQVADINPCVRKLHFGISENMGLNRNYVLYYCDDKMLLSTRAALLSDTGQISRIPPHSRFLQTHCTDLSIQ
jgi:hypothetical protein